MLCSVWCKNVATIMDAMQVLLLQVLNLMPEVGKFTPETRWMHRQARLRVISMCVAICGLC